MADPKVEKRKYCGHCNEFVALRTYRRHEQLYFHTKECRWKKSHDSSDEELGGNCENDNESQASATINTNKHQCVQGQG
jgi:hypothetical protein